jgi:glycogen operon protein
MGRTQRGNNNSYCQDSDISWVAWPPDPGREPAAGRPPEGATEDPPEEPADMGPDEALLDFTRELIALRTSHPVFRRRRFFQGEPISGRHDQVGDIAWFTPGAEEMTDEDWSAGFAKSLTVFLNGDGISEPDSRGQRVRDDSFLLLFNASENDLKFAVPPAEYGEEWQRVFDTAAASGAEVAVRAGDTIEVSSRSLQVLRRG